MSLGYGGGGQRTGNERSGWIAPHFAQTGDVLAKEHGPENDEGGQGKSDPDHGAQGARRQARACNESDGCLSDFNHIAMVQDGIGHHVAIDSDGLIRCHTANTDRTGIVDDFRMGRRSVRIVKPDLIGQLASDYDPAPLDGAGVPGEGSGLENQAVHTADLSPKTGVTSRFNAAWPLTLGVSPGIVRTLMTNSPEQQPVSAPDSEEWFLERLDHRPVPVAEMLVALDHLVSLGATVQADLRAKLLQDVLAEAGEFEAAVDVILRRTTWLPATPETSQLLRQEIDGILSRDPARRTRLGEAGFDRPNVTPREAVRRTRVLLALAPETLCYDKTWKFGVVRRLDPVIKKVEIDFETRQGHAMAYSYAAETLQILGHDHLLAQWHRDPEAIRALVTDHPAEIIRMALRSFGPLSVPQLQDQLVPRLLPEADWKKFWEAARRELKQDPLVIIPTKRTEPLTLRASAEDYGADWFRRLAAERDMKRILEMVEEFEEAVPTPPADTPFQITGERLSFVLKGAGMRLPGLAARAGMAISRLGLPLSAEQMETVSRAGRDGEMFDATASALPARELAPWLKFLGGLVGVDALAAFLLQRLHLLTYSVFEESMEWLLEHGREEACAQALRAVVATRRPGIEVLLWIVKDPRRIESWKLGALPDLAFLMLDAMEADASGDRLKAQNQLRERYDRPEWVALMVESMSDEQRRSFMMRLRETSAWPKLERQAFIGKLVKQCPVMEEHLHATSAGATESRKLPLTSMRSYLERQEQLRKIVEVEIPKNSREIEVARSYGDLRENFEYKAAKDMQALLMRRQGELSQQLRSVQATDFEGMPCEMAGPATCIGLGYPDGRKERYVLLGVWDRDEALGIISSDSQLAKTLFGHRTGEEVDVPTESGISVKAKIESVGPLPPEIQAWVRGGA